MKFLKENMPKGKAAWMLLGVSLVICILTGIGIWATYYYFENPQMFRDFVEEHYALGVLIMLFMFIIQVILALIPGGLLEVACGYAFGSVAGGTCRAANLPGLDVCGKTGTAQNRGKDHSAFMGFAPMNDPKIAVSVYVENGGWGATYGVPIVQRIA